ncbi:MAG: arginase family protein [Hamadaea sp.]|uniref:arginase family protein n=1 Tax=Hamadaea sp. TaxID=2024425 RepID=UPI00179ED014|nr:arginase family protein [Hamadaea sp.]NUT18573.1 arginase family protein [Hamadaea sp.]
MIELITAPSSLGLRPLTPGHEPGAWQAPQVLLDAGLADQLGAHHVVTLEHPDYDFEAQPLTRLRNGHGLRAYSMILAEVVGTALAAGRFPVVVGGDCSNLLGSLAGARRDGRCGLAHLDGHNDFFHPNNYDTAARLGSAAGMDLALATGRGEPLLTHWPIIGTPLVTDADVVQLGDRETDVPATQTHWAAVEDSAIVCFTAQQMLAHGIATTVARTIERFDERRLDRIWLHLDVDILDAAVMPAVDSPGSPGLDFAQLTELLAGLAADDRVIGADVGIYDPEMDPDRLYSGPIAEALGTGFASRR